jgi:hypothetical protein
VKNRESLFPIADPKIDRQMAYVCDHFERHLVCLGVLFVELDEKGQPSGHEKFLACSGFVMELHGMCFIVTAGHVIQLLDRRLANKEIAIKSSIIVDYFGKDAKVELPTHFSYEAAKRGAIDHDGIGLDLGLIHLSEFFRNSILANNVIPITRANWEMQDQVTFHGFFLLGFPAYLVEEQSKRDSAGNYMDIRIPTVLIPVNPILNAAEIPDTVIIPESVLPWFVGRCPDRKVKNIEGMSGGPILGVHYNEDGGLSYWIVALQSGWFEASRIIRGCPVAIFAEIVEESLREFNATNDNIA